MTEFVINFIFHHDRGRERCLQQAFKSNVGLLRPWPLTFLSLIDHFPPLLRGPVVQICHWNRLIRFQNIVFTTLVTSSSAVGDRPRDASRLSVVSFSSMIPRAPSFIIVTLTSRLPQRTIKCGSVVFVVTLRLLVIHFVVVSYHQQTPSLTSD